MKQVVVQAFCDGNHDDPVRSTVERIVQIDGSKRMLLDVCDDCDQMFSIMLTFMERGALADEVEQQPKKAASPRKAPVKKASPKVDKKAARRVARATGRDPSNDLSTVCPDCSFVSVSRSALGQHLSTKHNKRFGDYTEQQMEHARERAINMQTSAPRRDEDVPEPVSA